MDGGGPAAGPGRAVRAPAAVAARRAEVRLEAEGVGHPAQVAAGAGVGAGVALAHAAISSNIPTLLATDLLGAAHPEADDANPGVALVQRIRVLGGLGDQGAAGVTLAGVLA